MEYRVKIIKRSRLAHEKIGLHLERPEGFRFVSGHNIDVGLVNQAEIDPSDSARTFSIASAPHEKDLLIAARLRSNPYKESLNDLPIGSELTINGPYGTFRLHQDISRPAAFLVGGIGITPVLSMIRQAAAEQRDYPIYLFYANRRMEDTAFHDELESYRDKFETYTYVPTFSRQETSDIEWHGETGYIGRAMLERYIPDLSSPQYYVVGPTPMVWGTLQELENIVDRSLVKVEDFTGFD